VPRHQQGTWLIVYCELRVLAVQIKGKRGTALVQIESLAAPAATQTGSQLRWRAEKRPASSTCLAANRSEPICEKARSPWYLWLAERLVISSSGCSELTMVSAVINSRSIWMNSYFVTIGGRHRRRRSKLCSALEPVISPLNMRTYAGHPTWFPRNQETERRYGGSVRHESEESQTSHNRPGIASGLHSGATAGNVTEYTDVCPRLFRGKVARDLRGLFVPQRHHRVDAHGAPCWEVASECSDSDQSERCEKHRLNICGLHTKKDATMKRVPPTAPAIPAMTPIRAIAMPRPRTSLSTRNRSAPRAIRIPISCVL